VDLEPEHEMELDWRLPFMALMTGPAKERVTDADG
jgi:hypothetical protein